MLDNDSADFLRYTATKVWGPRSTAYYTRLVGSITAFLRQRGCRRASDVCPADLAAFLAHLLEAGWSLSYRLQHAGLITRWFGWLQERGRIVTNPARGLPAPADTEEVLPPDPLSESDVQSLFATLPRYTVGDLRQACLIELLYGCGMRIGETLALDLGDLNLTAGTGTVHVRHGKGNQQRLLPLMDTAAAAVCDYLAMRRTLLHGPDPGAVFLTNRGQRMTKGAVEQWFRRLNAMRGPGARHLYPHLFRHSVAVHLLRNGAEIRTIQEFLGHAMLDTTKIYLRLVPGHLREDYDKAMPEIAVDTRPAG